MYTRHLEVPVFEYRQGQLEARLYNQARLALTRLKSPIRFSLPGLKTLDLIVQSDAWIIVDRALNDVPVVAWNEFDHHRSALHKPVNCEIRLFHANAGIILKSSLTALEQLLRQRLSKTG